MDINQKYNLWLTFDDETKKELESVNDKKEIEDRFYKDLEFGTGGLRGIMGAGTNRMNSYTVGKASLGFAKYLKDKYDGEISVVIACDSRLNSRAFEWDSARVFASQGIKVYAYTQI
ncbi:MAG: phospho-sugar mutase, partial [Eubacterium coprostanoligenes]|nr:phospho-sugar mutase [Eubacterium coprostanoligenes]